MAVAWVFAPFWPVQVHGRFRDASCMSPPSRPWRWYVRNVCKLHVATNQTTSADGQRVLASAYALRRLTDCLVMVSMYKAAYVIPNDHFWKKKRASITFGRCRCIAERHLFIGLARKVLSDARGKSSRLQGSPKCGPRASINCLTFLFGIYLRFQVGQTYRTLRKCKWDKRALLYVIVFYSTTILFPRLLNTNRAPCKK